MEISIRHLLEVGVKPTKAQLYVEHINAAMKRFDISSAHEQAAFLAQFLHESAMLNSSEEGLSYSSVDRIKAVFKRLRNLDIDVLTGLVRNPVALANTAYAGINGNTEPGDGWRFRGRGGFQLTGRGNYTKAADALCVDYVNNPDLVARPKDMCLTAAWYWASTQAQARARRGDYLGVTEAINGPAKLEHDKREILRMKLLRSMGVLKA